MRKLEITILFFCFLFFAITLSGGICIADEYMFQDSLNNFHENEIIMKFKNGKSVNITKNQNGIFLTSGADIDRLNIQYKCIDIKKMFQQKKEKAKTYEELNLGSVYIFRFESIDDLNKLLKDYSNTGKFEYVEPNFIGKGGGYKSIDPNDEYYYRQWSLENDGTFPPGHSGIADADIDMDEAWEIEQGDSSIVIAILDTGVKLDHPEVSGRIWVNTQEIPDNGVDDDENGYFDDYKGWDFSYSDNNPADGHGHGTNVTGILGSTGNNNVGYAGVNWNSKLMICKILNDENWGYYSWWAQAIYYAVNNGAKVLNMSVGGSSFSSSLQDAVNYAYQNNVTIVSIMMNDNNDVPYYPGAYQNTIAVGATDTDDTRCNPFFWGGGSNYGPHIDVVAPGNYIYGLNHQSDTNYSWYWGGTSQAAPHVTGLVSLLLAQDSSRAVDEIRDIIRNTAEDQVGNSEEDTLGWDMYHGYGRINAKNALNDTSTSVEHHQEELTPFSIKLFQNYPNPFNPSTKISYSIAGSDFVTLKIYDILGREIQMLMMEFQKANTYSANFDANRLSSGVYFYKLQVGNDFVETKKMLFMK